jgi:hypothetical protein
MPLKNPVTPPGIDPGTVYQYVTVKHSHLMKEMKPNIGALGILLRHIQ